MPSPRGQDHTAYGSATDSGLSVVTYPHRRANGVTVTPRMSPATAGSWLPTTATATSPPRARTRNSAGARHRTTATRVGLTVSTRAPWSSTGPAPGSPNVTAVGTAVGVTQPGFGLVLMRV